MIDTQLKTTVTSILTMAAIYALLYVVGEVLLGG